MPRDGEEAVGVSLSLLSREVTPQRAERLPSLVDCCPRIGTIRSGGSHGTEQDEELAPGSKGAETPGEEQKQGRRERSTWVGIGTRRGATLSPVMLILKLRNRTHERTRSPGQRAPLPPQAPRNQHPHGETERVPLGSSEGQRLRVKGSTARETCRGIHRAEDESGPLPGYLRPLPGPSGRGDPGERAATCGLQPMNDP